MCYAIHYYFFDLTFSNYDENCSLSGFLKIFPAADLGKKFYIFFVCIIYPINQFSVEKSAYSNIQGLSERMAKVKRFLWALNFMKN